MAVGICEWAEVCPFFINPTGYSPALYQAMRTQYCLEDCTDCVRLLAMDIMDGAEVPDEILPTDTDWLERERARRGSAE